MRRLIVIPGLAALLVAGGAYWLFWTDGSGAASGGGYRLAKVESGLILSAVTAAGTVNAVTTVQVGSQLSGQIKELYADFNSVVKANQALAKLDTDHLEAKHRAAIADLEASRAAHVQSQAQLENMRAAVAASHAQAERAQAMAKDAERDYARKKSLLERGAATASETDKAETQRETTRAELSAARASFTAAEAAVRVAAAQIVGAAAQINQREAAIDQVQVDLDRSTIRSPIDGVVVQRSIDLGQTVAASLQAPTMFTIAQDLRQMEVHTNIDEGDIGKVIVGQDTTFTVTAYPNETFEGRIAQIRLGPQNIQNVVTYIVVVAADNPDLKLLPGMTANVRIVASERQNALKVPNAALRFRPTSVTGAAPSGSAQASPPARRGGPNQLDAMARTLTEALVLDAQQQKRLEDVVAEFRPRFRELFTSDLPGDQRAERARGLRRAMNDRITQILDSEQRKKFVALANSRQAQDGAQGQVYVIETGAEPRAISLRLGVSDGAHTEVLAGEVRPGQDVIIGLARPPSATTTPAVPPQPRRLF